MRKIGMFVFSVIAIATFVAATTMVSIGQERQMGGVGITIFFDRNFKGKSSTFREDVPDLAPLGINDKISSLKVAEGERWEVCENANYQGRCVVVSGEESDLRKNSWNDMISSFRRVDGGVSAGSPTPGGPYIVLFDQPNYRGNPTNYNGAAPSMNATAQSVTIGRGTWQLCDRLYFTGNCITLSSSVPDLAAYNMRNRVVSVRPFGYGNPNTPPAGSDWYIVLFDQPGYRGNPRNYTNEVSNLNRRAGSVTIGRGAWEICEGKNFTGRCVTLDQSVPDLASYNFRKRISSLRPVTRQPR